MLMVAAAMMGVVLLSQPRAATYVQSGLDRVEGMMASVRSDEPQPTADPAAAIEITKVSAFVPTPAAETAAHKKPTVLSMPTSRIPVNRIRN